MCVFDLMAPDYCCPMFLFCLLGRHALVSRAYDFGRVFRGGAGGSDNGGDELLNVLRKCIASYIAKGNKVPHVLVSCRSWLATATAAATAKEGPVLSVLGSEYQQRYKRHLPNAAETALKTSPPKKTKRKKNQVGKEKLKFFPARRRRRSLPR